MFFLKKTALKKFLIFSQKKELLYSGKWNFQAQARKIKKTLTKFPIFSQKKLSLYFRKRNYLIFQEMELSYISGNGNPKKLLIFQEVTFRARKNKKLALKKVLYFGKCNFLAPSLKDFLYFSG